ncbi:MAG: type II toxin-antitoxin system HicA family toxin [Burkholderiales bacterium]
MTKLAGFKYRQIVKRLKGFGFEFHRQAAGSHEIWFNPTTRRYTTILNHPGDMPEGCARFSSRPSSTQMNFSKRNRMPVLISRSRF